MVATVVWCRKTRSDLLILLTACARSSGGLDVLQESCTARFGRKRRLSRPLDPVAGLPTFESSGAQTKTIGSSHGSRVRELFPLETGLLEHLLESCHGLGIVQRFPLITRELE